ncbi:hypothetical protein [Endozoicomonas sp. Mp262]|uniref:hypothetical protein n=1 Tax=Endozoicomonas sp. Mp262 TaxID=2919499 RepID=UPI0021DA2EBE
MRHSRVFLVVLNILYFQIALADSCNPVTYAKILKEFDHYIDEVDRIDWQLNFYCLHAKGGQCPKYDGPMKGVLEKRDELLWDIAKIKDELDKQQINLADSLMGSSTGYCIKDGILKVVEINATDKKDKKTASYGKAAPENYYYDFPGYQSPYFNRHWHKKRLKLTRKHIRQKDRQDLAQIERASTLGSVGGCYGKSCYSTKPADSYVLLKSGAWPKSRAHGFTGKK